MTIRAHAERLLSASIAAIVVEVSATRGSVPREAGTRMLVTADRCLGTVGGGHLELRAIGVARDMLRTGETVPHEAHYALGPALGQCCGGAVSLSFALLDDASLRRWPVAAPLFHLQLFGAGHVGRAIADLLATLPITVDWIDERETEFPSAPALGGAWPAHIRRHCVSHVVDEVIDAPHDSGYLVLTHRHDLDLAITEAILRRGDFGFLGLIGSQTKRARFVHHFERRGIAADVIDRMHCPIGITGIAAKAPEMIAIAVVAQLLQSAERAQPQPQARIASPEDAASRRAD